MSIFLIALRLRHRSAPLVFSPTLHPCDPYKPRQLIQKELEGEPRVPAARRRRKPAFAVDNLICTGVRLTLFLNRSSDPYGRTVALPAASQICHGRMRWPGSVRQDAKRKARGVEGDGEG